MPISRKVWATLSDESKSVILRLSNCHEFLQVVDTKGPSLDAIAKAAHEVLYVDDLRTDIQRPRKGREEQPRSYRPWSTPEDAELSALHYGGISVARIAELFQRGEPEIHRRLLRITGSTVVRQKNPISRFYGVSVLTENSINWASEPEVVLVRNWVPRDVDQHPPNTYYGLKQRVILRLMNEFPLADIELAGLPWPPIGEAVAITSDGVHHISDDLVRRINAIITTESERIISDEAEDEEESEEFGD